MKKLLYFVLIPCILLLTCIFGITLHGNSDRFDIASMPIIVPMPIVKLDDHIYLPKDIIVSMFFPFGKPGDKRMSFADYDKEIEGNIINRFDFIKDDSTRKMRIRSWNKVQRKFVFAIYKDATAIWSEDFINGGIPFHVGKIDLANLSYFITKSESNDSFKKLKNSKKYAQDNSSMLYIRSNETPVCVFDSYEFAEQNPNFVVLDTGEVKQLAPLEKKSEILDQQSEEYLQMRMEFSEIKKYFALLFKSSSKVEYSTVEIQGFYNTNLKTLEVTDYVPEKPRWDMSRDELNKDNDRIINESFDMMIQHMSNLPKDEFQKTLKLYEDQLKIDGEKDRYLGNFVKRLKDLENKRFNTVD